MGGLGGLGVRGGLGGQTGVSAQRGFSGAGAGGGHTGFRGNGGAEGNLRASLEGYNAQGHGNQYSDRSNNRDDLFLTHFLFLPAVISAKKLFFIASAHRLAYVDTQRKPWWQQIVKILTKLFRGAYVACPPFGFRAHFLRYDPTAHTLSFCSGKLKLDTEGVRK